MEKKEIYSELLEKYNLHKAEAISFVNHRVGVAVDKAKMLEIISANIDKLAILCGDLKLEIRLHESNPLVIINNQQFFTTNQAAEILNVSTTKVRQLIEAEKLQVKKINQRNWKIPNWSLEAYKNDLTNFLFDFGDRLSAFTAIDILDDENQLLISLVSNLGIHQLHEHEGRLSRKISAVISEL